MSSTTPTTTPTTGSPAEAHTRDITLWHTLSVRDADAASAWLRAVGFTELATYRDDHDPSVVLHSEWVWPGGGGLMLGTAREDSPLWGTGPAAAYLVTDDPDGAFEAALAAGGRVVRPMAEQPYGGRGGSVQDPEGNHWSFGSYRPR